VRRYTKDDNVDFIVGPIASHVVGAIRDAAVPTPTLTLPRISDHHLTHLQKEKTA
jgi:hypothetical protein